MSNFDALIQDLVIANRILASEEVVDAYGHEVRQVYHPPLIAAQSSQTGCAWRNSGHIRI